jgi:sugar (pentulose or hexulose) kinase
MQIMADTLDLPIRLTQNPEMGIIGAACVARHGEGAALLECSREIMKDAGVIKPEPRSVSIYKELSKRYFDVRESLRLPLLARQGCPH